MEISFGLERKKTAISSTSGFQNKEHHNILEDTERELESEANTKNTDQNFEWTYTLSIKQK